MRAGRRRAEAHDSLNRIFELGTLPEPALDGRFEGVAVTPTTFVTADPALRALASLWMPCLGKRFDAETQTGDNVMLPSARLPSKLFWPGYRFRSMGDGRYAAFRFHTYSGAGALDRERRVLKIDYDWDENPSLLIRDILDELVQVVPDVYLGKALLRLGGPLSSSWRLDGYFALHPATPSPLLTPAAAGA